QPGRCDQDPQRQATRDPWPLARDQCLLLDIRSDSPAVGGGERLCAQHPALPAAIGRNVPGGTSTLAALGRRLNRVHRRPRDVAPWILGSAIRGGCCRVGRGRYGPTERRVETGQRWG